MESSEEMTITPKTRTTTIEIEEMWNARATFELCRFQRDEMTPMFFLLFVVASAFIYLFRHHQTNHRVGPLNRVKQKKKRETAEFCAAQISLCSFFLFSPFFVLALTRGYRAIWPSGLLLREGRCLFFFLPFLFYKKKIQGWKIGPAVHTLFIYCRYLGRMFSIPRRCDTLRGVRKPPEGNSI